VQRNSDQDCACRGCQIRDAFDRAAGLLTTFMGQLVRGSLYSDQIAPAYPQPHKTRDGIPYNGLLPTIQIDAPANPDLILDIPLFNRIWLRPMRRIDNAPTRNVVTNRRQTRWQAWHGRSG
jgi:hypothetical protein